MYQLTLINYILIILALVSHYEIGKRFGIKSFFTAILTGLSASAMIVAILANVSAGMIRPYILIIIFIGFSLLIYDLFKNRKQIKYKFTYAAIKKYTLFIAVGVIFLVCNNPKTIFFKTEATETLFYFNSHYTYYASQPIEMLNATYDGRLKVANFYPYVWGMYHFFNSATQAIAQGLITHPTLITFFITQLIIIAVIFLAFAENFILFYGWSKKNLLLIAAWFILGLTIFSNSLSWNLSSTSPFSVFAAVLIILNLLSKKYREAILFIFILGISAFRMLPIAGCLILFFLIIYFIKSKFKLKDIIHQLKEIKFINYLSLIIYIFYIFVTLFSATNLPRPYDFHQFPIFAEQAMYLLFTYKFFGYLANLLGVEKLLFFNNSGFFNKILYSHWLSAIVLVVILIGFIYILFEVIYIGQKRSKALLYGFVLLSLLTIVYQYFSPHYTDIKLYIIAMPYLILMLIFGFRLTEQLKYIERIIFYCFIILAFTLSVIYLYVDIDTALKIPPIYIIFDVFLWAIIGAHIMIVSNKKIFFLINIFFAITMLLLLKPVFIGMTKTSDEENNSIKIPVTELFLNNFQRSNYVDNNNMLTISTSDPGTLDAYSSLLGANIAYTPGHETFMNYYFTDFGRSQ